MQRNNLFISYAHADPGVFIDEILKHLRVAFRSLPEFEVWSDDKIHLTEGWEQTIRDALSRSSCAILLISVNFLDSEFIYEQELPIILTRVKDEQLGLIPVFLSPVPKRSLNVEFPYRGKTERFDLASKQGPNGPDNPLNMNDEGERAAILAKLADEIRGRLIEQGPTEPQTRPTRGIKIPPLPVSLGEKRPELLVQLARWNEKVQRHYFFEGWSQPREFPTPETDAENTLTYWDPCLPFDGDQLTALLFGGDPELCDQILAVACGREDQTPETPIRYPLRIRLLTDDPHFMQLPWASISYQGIALKDYGWTVELSSQPVPDERPPLSNHGITMPGPILLTFSLSEYRTDHFDDLVGLFKALWPKRSALFEARDLEELASEFKERTPRLFYYFGSGFWDKRAKSYFLEMPSRNGQVTELAIEQLADYFASKGPQVVFLNLVDEQGCRALADAPTLLPHTKAVIIHCASQQDITKATEVGYRWFAHLLDHRADPVSAYHHADAVCGGCWTAYQDWRTDTDASLDDDLAEYFLDRNEQSEHLLGACGELVNRASPLRVQFRLAIGAQGNRVRDFRSQAEFYLAENAFAGSYCYSRGPIRLFADTTTSEAVETQYRRNFRLGPNADLFAPLRTHAPEYSGELLVPLLAWELTPDDTQVQDIAAVTQAVLQWNWEVLAIGCPDDLRIISLLLVEMPSDSDIDRINHVLRDHNNSLRSRAGPRPSFKFKEMRRLSGVDETHLRDYFDSPVCWCWDALRPVYPRLLLKGRAEMSFDEAVRHIKQAKRIGWGVMAEQLRK